MPHKRSIVGLQKRDVKTFLRALNFHDAELAEIVFTVREEQLFALLMKKYGFVHLEAAELFYSLTNRHSIADILIDKRGRGTLQRMPKPIENRLWR